MTPPTPPREIDPSPYLPYYSREHVETSFLTISLLFGEPTRLGLDRGPFAPPAGEQLEFLMVINQLFPDRRVDGYAPRTIYDAYRKWYADNKRSQTQKAHRSG